ncbi:hypothetical protein [Brevibacterium permense]|nr:hypothetical protein [Brevibacterium permense]
MTALVLRYSAPHPETKSLPEHALTPQETITEVDPIDADPKRVPAPDIDS